MTIYACPIHPEIQSQSPASCSRCGLKLEPQEEQRATVSRKPKSAPIREKH